MGKLTGKTAIVTGGARGLGRTYALRLASLGADVGIIDVNLHSFEEYKGEADLLTAETVMDEIRAMGRKSLGIQVDVTDRKAVTDAVNMIADELGALDIIICNAGGGMGSLDENPVTEMNYDHFETVLDRNLKGTLYTVNAAAEIMKKQRSGKIITVASHTGINVIEGGNYAHYGMAKAGIIFMTRSASVELGPYGITVNCIAPGYIATGRLLKQFNDTGLTERFESKTSLRRLGTPEDCAGVIEFLSTDLSDFVTGEVIRITGGTTEKL